jgi:hypothetical protein
MFLEAVNAVDQLEAGDAVLMLVLVRVCVCVRFNLLYVFRHNHVSD